MSLGQHRSRPAGEPSGLRSAGLADLAPEYASNGLDRAIDVAERDWWSQGAAMAIRQLALTGRGFTSEHLIELCGYPHESHLVGAAFAAAQRSGVITAVGAVIGRDGEPRRVWWAAERGSRARWK